VLAAAPAPRQPFPNGPIANHRKERLGEGCLELRWHVYFGHLLGGDDPGAYLAEGHPGLSTGHADVVLVPADGTLRTAGIVRKFRWETSFSLVPLFTSCLAINRLLSSLSPLLSRSIACGIEFEFK